MRKTAYSETANRLAVDISTLQAMLCCGRGTAQKVGEDAGARIQLGKRVLYNVARVQAYLDSISEGAIG